MFSTLWDTLVQMALELGYVGLGLMLAVEGLGLPFPGDATLAFLGYLAGTGKLKFSLLVMFTTLGCSLGSLVAFFLGKRYGLTLLRQYGRYMLISERSIEVTQRFCNRYGVLVLLFGRLLPGVRTLSSYMAGVGGLHWPVFVPLSAMGFLLFCLFWSGVGYLLGENWTVLLLMMKKYLVLFTAAVMILIIFITWRRWRRK